jgi:hypothetical protein
MARQAFSLQYWIDVLDKAHLPGTAGTQCERDNQKAEDAMAVAHGLLLILGLTAYFGGCISYLSDTGIDVEQEKSS